MIYTIPIGTNNKKSTACEYALDAHITMLFCIVPQHVINYFNLKT